MNQDQEKTKGLESPPASDAPAAQPYMDAQHALNLHLLPKRKKEGNPAKGGGKKNPPAD